jgi:hypothetical protein
MLCPKVMLCRMLILVTVLAASLTAAAMYYPPARATITQWLSGPRELLQSAPGFYESLTLIFMTELGDKTFFIAALLAMRVGKAAAFFGSVASLGIMTVVSVGIGLVCAQIPQFVDQSAATGQYIGAALLAYFGARNRL